MMSAIVFISCFSFNIRGQSVAGECKEYAQSLSPWCSLPKHYPRPRQHPDGVLEPAVSQGLRLEKLQVLLYNTQKCQPGVYPVLAGQGPYQAPDFKGSDNHPGLFRR